MGQHWPDMVFISKGVGHAMSPHSMPLHGTFMASAPPGCEVLSAAALTTNSDKSNRRAMLLSCVEKAFVMKAWLA